MMCAICQTSDKKDDVRTNVNAMIKTGERGRIIQTGDVKCPKLEKGKDTDSQKIMDLMATRRDNRVIDVPKKTLHKVGCLKCGNDSVNAAILNDNATRLKICSCLG